MTFRAAVVILAGGIGSRMRLPGSSLGPDGGSDNKVYLTIGGRGMLHYSVETMARSPSVVEIVVVARPEDHEYLAPILSTAAGDTPIRTTPGGASRHASERAGLAAIRADIESGRIDVVAVHDGARPFVSPELLERVLNEAAASGGAIPGLHVEDTLFTLDRDSFVDPADYAWVQTPQAFAARTVLTAHDRAVEAGHDGVDTAEVVQSFTGQRIRLVAGDPANIKVTYQGDLARAEAIARDRGLGQAG